MKCGLGRSHLFVIFPISALQIYLPLNGRKHCDPLGIRGHINNTQLRNSCIHSLTHGANFANLVGKNMTRRVALIRLKSSY